VICDHLGMSGSLNAEIKRGKTDKKDEAIRGYKCFYNAIQSFIHEGHFFTTKYLN
jgi:hypothetical protein